MPHVRLCLKIRTGRSRDSAIAASSAAVSGSVLSLVVGKMPKFYQFARGSQQSSASDWRLVRARVEPGFFQMVPDLREQLGGRRRQGQPSFMEQPVDIVGPEADPFHV